MAIYHVIINESDVTIEPSTVSINNIDAVMKQLDEHYPDHHVYNSQKGLVFVRTNDIAEEIANKLNINGPNESSYLGAVFKMNSDYSGFTSRGIWQWLKNDD